jgi:hypothetical protein
MNETMQHLIGGAVNAGILSVVLWALGTRRAMWGAAALLLVAGINYVIFAARAAQLEALPLDIGTLLVTAFAVTGIRRRTPSIIALGWALHPVWDVAFHTRGLGTYTPNGYALACISFDFILAGAIMLIAARRPLKLAEVARV